MTSGEILKREADEIAQRTGRYIPPYRMANLMKTAQKIMDLLTKADICMTYEEFLIILRIVSGAIEEVIGKDRR